jgi:hypothetical protein
MILMVDRFRLRKPADAYFFTTKDLLGKEIEFVSFTFDGVSQTTWFKKQFDDVFVLDTKEPQPFTPTFADGTHASTEPSVLFGEGVVISQPEPFSDEQIEAVDGLIEEYGSRMRKVDYESVHSELEQREITQCISFDIYQVLVGSVYLKEK